MTVEGKDKNEPHLRMSMALMHSTLLEWFLRFVYNDLKELGANEETLRLVGPQIGRARKIRTHLKIAEEKMLALTDPHTIEEADADES